MRTIVELPEEQILKLKQLSRDKDLSRAELIRRALSEYLKENISLKEDPAFGILKNAPIDSIVHERKLRDEWNR